MADHAHPVAPVNGARDLRLVDELAALGPFFAVRTHPMGSTPRDPWRPMNELIDGPAAVDARIAAVRAALAATGGRASESVEVRVAASVVHLGLVARVVSPLLAIAVLGGKVPTLTLAQMWWQPVLGGPFPLSLLDTCASHARRGARDPHRCADLLESRVVCGPVEEVTRLLRARSVSARVLGGNVASAVNGATQLLARARPELADHACRVRDQLLELPTLRGAGSITVDSGFRRRSCCLIYRVAAADDHTLCGDCVLTPRHA
jgi:hypothetical protein